MRHSQLLYCTVNMILERARLYRLDRTYCRHRFEVRGWGTKRWLARDQCKLVEDLGIPVRS